MAPAFLLFASFGFQISLQMLDGLMVPFKSKSLNGLDSGEGYVRHLSERLTVGHLGNVNFHRGNGNRFQRVQNGYAGMRVSGWIDDDPIDFSVSLLDLVHDHTLMVGLKDLAFHVGLSTPGP